MIVLTAYERRSLAPPPRHPDLPNAPLVPGSRAARGHEPRPRPRPLLEVLAEHVAEVTATRTANPKD